MTTTQIAVGPELDALIEERVMKGEGEWDRNHGVREHGWWDEDGWVATPEYSTDIVAAWQVVERVKEDGSTIDVQSATPGWRCIIDEQLDCRVEVRSETAPEAICRAALAAVPE